MNFYWYLRASQMIVLQSGDALRTKASATDTSTECLARWWCAHSLTKLNAGNLSPSRPFRFSSAISTAWAFNTVEINIQNSNKLYWKIRLNSHIIIQKWYVWFWAPRLQGWSACSPATAQSFRSEEGHAYLNKLGNLKPQRIELAITAGYPSS